MNERLAVDVLLVIHSLIDLAVIFITARWGVGFWRGLNAGQNGLTASMMFLFFTMANYFVSVFFNVFLQFSFIPLDSLDSYRIVARLWNLASFGLLFFVLLLVDRKFRGVKSEQAED